MVRDKQAKTKRKYNVQRTLLILLMGSKCAYCQERRPWVLEFHHTVRVKKQGCNTGRLRRIRLYMREWLDGVCVLACGTCNKKKGQPPNPNEEPIPL
jgi:hypothetical protein